VLYCLSVQGTVHDHAWNMLGCARIAPNEVQRYQSE